MARPCGPCSHLQRRAIDRDLSEGVPVQSISRDYELSVSALNRHRSRHLSASLLREIRASAEVGDADLVDTLLDVLSDMNAVRRTAVATGQGALVLRAGTATREVVGDLLDLLGIDAASVSQQLIGGQVLAKATARTIRETPAFGSALAVHLEDFNDVAMAMQVRELVHRSSKGITE
jgi:hypothetical protein